jgi:hypothetical protein
MSDHLALASRVREALAELDPVVDRVLLLGDKAQQTGDEDYWDGVALNLHGFYTGVERIFEDIARTIDESVPVTAQWHRDLLLQMSAELNDVRPPVITRSTRHCLDEYRAFRHVVRNVYTYRLRVSRMQELVSELRHCLTLVSQDLEAFARFLEDLA